MPENPPAFPRPQFTQPNGDYEFPNDGMALRDYFAAKALQGAIASGALKSIAQEVAGEKQDMTEHGVVKVTNRLLARMMYEIADAMLAERSKQ